MHRVTVKVLKISKMSSSKGESSVSFEQIDFFNNNFEVIIETRIQVWFLNKFVKM